MRLQEHIALIATFCAAPLIQAQSLENNRSVPPDVQRCDTTCIEEQLSRMERMGYSSARKKYELCVPECAKQSQDDLSSQSTANAACSDRCIEGHGNPPKRPMAGAPINPIVRPTGNNRAFILIEPMKYEIGSTKVFITVPVGFVTDYASIPKQLWSLYSPHDQYSRAAILHDYLYWTQLCTRQQADNLFMIAMKESEVPEITRNNVYLGVRGGGGLSWAENQYQRMIERKPRVIPINRKDFPPNWSWEMYRAHLVSNGVRDPVFQGNDYCVYGNSTEVPRKPLTKSKKEKELADATLVMRPKWQ